MGQIPNGNSHKASFIHLNHRRKYSDTQSINSATTNHFQISATFCCYNNDLIHLSSVYLSDCPSAFIASELQHQRLSLGLVLWPR